MSIQSSCTHCGHPCQIEDESADLATCPTCNQVFEIRRALPTRAAQAMSPAFGNFNEEGVTITESQIIARGMVVSTRNISAINSERVDAKRGWPVFSICFGIFFAFLAIWFIALLLIIPAAILLFVRRDKFRITILSGGAESFLEFKNRDTAERAAYAISMAMK